MKHYLVVEKVVNKQKRLTGTEQSGCKSLSLKPIVLAKSMETLEFVIYPDGRVQEKVNGIVGNTCADVTAAIEAELGQVVSHQPSSEFFNATLQQSAVATTQTTFSEW